MSEAIFHSFDRKISDFVKEAAFSLVEFLYFCVQQKERYEQKIMTKSFVSLH